MNTDVANNGIEVYVNQIFLLADEYVETKLEGKEENVPENFRDMIFYLSDRIDRPDNNDIEALDCLFEAYVRLCTHYHKLPTLECFGWISGIDRNTFTDWKNGAYRSSTGHGRTVKKWLSICQGFVVDELSNSKFANPNLIFTAKAAYGLRETSLVPPPETGNNRVLTAAELPKLGDESSDN